MTRHHQLPVRPNFDYTWLFDRVTSILNDKPHVVSSLNCPVWLKLDLRAELPAGTMSEESTTIGRCYTLSTGKDAKAMSMDDWCNWYGKLVRNAADNPAKFKRALLKIPESAPMREVGMTIATVLMPSKQFPGTAAAASTKPPLEVSFIHTDFHPDSKPEMERHQAQAIRDGWELGQLANLQRFLGVCPLNILGIAEFANIARAFGPENGLTVSEPTDEEIGRMGLLQGVCLGSGGRQPRVICLQVDPKAGETEKINVHIGKGLVFDDGGPNAKGTENIANMERDMMGAAAVLAKMLWLGRHREKVTQTTIGIIVIAENRVDGDSYMNGDTLVSFDGRTVKITNTDAEGRLVLADAIAWACWKWEKRVSLLTTTATLTGHAHQTTGVNVSAVMVRGNSRDVFNQCEEIGAKVRDPMHRMEVLPEDTKAMQGETTDLINATKGVKERGAQKGAAFLWAFVPDWVSAVIHLDVARATDSGGENLASGVPRHAGTLWHIGLR